MAAAPAAADGPSTIAIGDALAVHLYEEQAEADLAPLFSDTWTGSRVWAAAHALVDELRQRRAALAGRRCIELGAGPGLVGLAAAAFGAASVVLTDQAEMLDLMRRNIALNPSSANVRAVELVWGGTALPVGIEPPFDLVLVSECVNPLYGWGSFEALAETISQLCSANTICLLSHEERGVGDSQGAVLKTFFEHCGKRSLTHRRLEAPAPRGGSDSQPASSSSASSIELYEIFSACAA